MFKCLIFSLMFLLLMQSSNAQPRKNVQPLKEQIEATLMIPNTHFGVAFKDMQTGDSLLINAKDAFHAASTMKTPVLMELFRQAQQGKFAMTDSVVIRNSFKSIVDGSEYALTPADDGDPALYSHIGESWPIDSLAYYMIIRSSNLATNLLIELVGAESVMQSLKTIGANDMKVLRGVEDGKAYEKGLNNTTTAYDLLLLFEKMAAGQLVSAAASQQMIGILLDQQFNEIIPAQLPAGIKVAHKTGSITGIHHDSGIVLLPDGRKYVLILLGKFAPEDEPKATEAMATVSKLVYNFVK